MATFRIGLSMAGAVSAGAYTAGVLDVLFEALDRWYEEKARGSVVPRHDVKLCVVSGASAGSMCSALTAVLAQRAFAHIRLNADLSLASGTLKNPMYQAWVEDIDIRPMLDTSDLDERQPLHSLLNTAPIDRILAQCLAYDGAPRERAWIDDPLFVRMTLSNLRGVPYAAACKGSGGTYDAMSEHADYMSFAIGDPDRAGFPRERFPEARRLPHHSLAGGSADWQQLGKVSVASGAFPAALKARDIARPGADYTTRHVGQGGNGAAPAWGRDEPEHYHFVSVDGGAFNNEPFGLAEDVLKWASGCAQLPEHRDTAHSGVVMVDPFVTSASLPDDFRDLPIESVLTKTVAAMVNQLRFRPEQLSQAAAEDIYSRFLIAPMRPGYVSRPGRSPLACGGISGFMGFFCEDFRRHDYQLGRLNCKAFLKEWLTIGCNNPIAQAGYDDLPPQIRARYQRSNGDFPIIPLMDDVAVHEPLPRYPVGAFAYDSIEKRVEKRIDAIFAHYKRRLGGVAGLYAALGWCLGRKQLYKLVERKIEAALENQQLR